jgi:hypothetical protein
MALALLLSVLAANPSTVTLDVPADLACPRAAKITQRLQEAGVKVVPAYGGLDVKVTLADSELTLTARRTIDGKTFRRAMKVSSGDCDAVEHLISVMVSAWVNPELPFLAPKRPFREPHPPASNDAGPKAAPP